MKDLEIEVLGFSSGRVWFRCGKYDKVKIIKTAHDAVKIIKHVKPDTITILCDNERKSWKTEEVLEEAKTCSYWNELYDSIGI